MTDRNDVFESPVLIAGGGPVGLALAADLGRRGVATMLVEEREDKLNPPKMLEVSVRTMEFCRQLGIVDQAAVGGFRATGRSTACSLPTCKDTSSAACAYRP